ncbi:MAG: chorismate synthase [Pyrinomonadaceae bacterium]|nr:chorismate synthase [Pyrinomonadaceae bacterium]
MNFRFTTAGESHGKALAAIVEGLPAGLRINISRIDKELWRRQQGYGRGGRMKIERDEIELLSGIRHGKTLGSPVSFLIRNRDFENWSDVMSSENVDASLKSKRTITRPRPGHADLAGGQKFQTKDLRDVLERASARETAARVACGAFAKILLSEFGIEIASHVVKLGEIPAEPIDAEWESIKSIPKNSPLRCSDTGLEKKMVAHVDEAKQKGDTLGGVFEVVAANVPVGLGSHTSWREKLDGKLARAVMSVPAVKAVEIGTGVRNAGVFGSEVHDEIVYSDGGFDRTSNRAGGLEGGITNGQEIRVRGYKKPISTLRSRLRSVNVDSKEAESASFERSDITAVPAAGVIGEAMVAIVLADAVRSKFGGDTLEEVLRNFESYMKTVQDY